MYLCYNMYMYHKRRKHKFVIITQRTQFNLHPIQEQKVIVIGALRVVSFSDPV